MKADFFTKNILEWSEKNLIWYPWREFKDPFQILISEILLRKTNSEKVSNIILKTLKKIPNVSALLAVSTDELENLLKPYGLSKTKALQLKKIVKILNEKFEGQIPSNKKDLMELPGVGDYISNAVLCFSFNMSVPIVDTNVIRLICRYFNFVSTKQRIRDDKKIWEFTASLLPEKNVKEFNYALLDFPKIVCKPKNPACDACVLASKCSYFNRKDGDCT
ncbi:endonuclease III domain-containing protein [Carboxydothermus ferrireducens]|uniref:A/G-specific adenine glycosylase n=1 Tax=Carboxydothermus ferrireducens DSM 11255 TaxID=1119529 RepID=A0ABX2R8C5_9THEO|nr:hypothetical protein [Carboxydothermus ferrireducens]NYE57174.1 A/G-specific adenine glycosylase [Carboxydothermus ferrireducens DSM 11255]